MLVDRDLSESNMGDSSLAAIGSLAFTLGKEFIITSFCSKKYKRDNTAPRNLYAPQWRLGFEFFGHPYSFPASFLLLLADQAQSIVS